MTFPFKNLLSVLPYSSYISLSLATPGSQESDKQSTVSDLFLYDLCNFQSGQRGNDEPGSANIVAEHRWAGRGREGDADRQRR